MVSRQLPKKTSHVWHVKQLVLSAFKERDLGETQLFLQMSVDLDRNDSCCLSIIRKQRHVDQLVHASGLGTACSKSLPMTKEIYNEPIGKYLTD
jgi:hypothetical protein